MSEEQPQPTIEEAMSLIAELRAEIEKRAQQPQFPMTNIAIGQNGVSISLVLGPGVSLNTTLDEAGMNAVCAQWVQTRKQIQDQLKMIEHVRSTKLN